MQLVIRTVDKYEGNDARQAAQHMGRGDVIAALPDDHEWGRLDLTNPSWVVLRVSISADEADAMTTGQGDDGTTPHPRVRVSDVDLDALIAMGYAGIPSNQEAWAVKTRFKEHAKKHGLSESEVKHDPANALATEVVDVSADDFRAARRRKPPIQDRGVIG